MTKDDLNGWADEAYRHMISEFTVAWIASKSDFGYEIALEWIESDEEGVAAAGWATLSYTAALKPAEALDIPAYRAFLDRVEANVHSSQNRVRHVMNAFVIAVGSYIAPLTEKATAVVEKMGKVSVDIGGTACKVPLATDYIKKIVDRGTVGEKRKSARC